VTTVVTLADVLAQRSLLVGATVPKGSYNWGEISRPFRIQSVRVLDGVSGLLVNGHFLLSPAEAMRLIQTAPVKGDA